MKKYRHILAGLVALCVIGGFVFFSLNRSSEPPADLLAPQNPDQLVKTHAPTRIKDLQIRDLKPGDGKGAKHGDQVEIHYTGWLYDPTKPNHKGSKFDSSLDRQQAYKFRLGVGQVIVGFDRGIE